MGIDMGTSGARALILDDLGEVHGQGSALLEDFGQDRNRPENWWLAVQSALDQALEPVARSRIASLSIDGTSGTVLAVDGGGAPIGSALMYNDVVTDGEILSPITAHAPLNSAVHGPSNALAKALLLQRRQGVEWILHQADWLAQNFSGRALSDENNALKTGYDPLSGGWPGWIAQTGMRMALLPEVLAAGSVVGPITSTAAQRFGLDERVQVVSGTTDGCASFLATGAKDSADAVTALGTTITLKILSDQPIFAPEYGIYSHKILGKWLAGGASNSGGNVLLHYFGLGEITSLSEQINPQASVTTNYYPLAKKGERFPINDPDLAPKLPSRSQGDAVFLHGLLDGMSKIEAMGYQKIFEVGGPKPATLRTVGGGASNKAWTDIRQKTMNIPMLPALSSEAAYGAALLAKTGFNSARTQPLPQPG
jgi:D-ribulokinase